MLSKKKTGHAPRMIDIELTCEIDNGKTYSSIQCDQCPLLQRGDGTCGLNTALAERTDSYWGTKISRTFMNTEE